MICFLGGSRSGLSLAHQGKRSQMCICGNKLDENVGKEEYETNLMHVVIDITTAFSNMLRLSS